MVNDTGFIKNQESSHSPFALLNQLESISEASKFAYEFENSIKLFYKLWLHFLRRKQKVQDQHSRHIINNEQKFPKFSDMNWNEVYKAVKCIIFHLFFTGKMEPNSHFHVVSADKEKSRPKNTER